MMQLYHKVGKSCGILAERQSYLWRINPNKVFFILYVYIIMGKNLAQGEFKRSVLAPSYNCDDLNKLSE